MSSFGSYLLRLRILKKAKARPASKMAPPTPPTTPPIMLLDELDRPELLLLLLLEPLITPGVTMLVTEPVVNDETCEVTDIDVAS